MVRANASVQPALIPGSRPLPPAVMPAARPPPPTGATIVRTAVLASISAVDHDVLNPAALGSDDVENFRQVADIKAMRLGEVA